jgi:hypothetical protein
VFVVEVEQKKEERKRSILAYIYLILNYMLIAKNNHNPKARKYGKALGDSLLKMTQAHERNQGTKNRNIDQSILRDILH